MKEVCAKDLVIKAGPIRSIPVNMQAAVQDNAQDMVECGAIPADHPARYHQCELLLMQPISYAINTL